MKPKALGPEFFGRSAIVVARELLGKFLVRKAGGRLFASMITETEAYIGPQDLAAHSSKGVTPRTKVMFGPPGRWYVYFTYGVHWMLNAVTGKAGHASAVLIRGLEDISGPGRLTRKLRIDRSFYGKAIEPVSGLWVEDRGFKIPRAAVKRTARIGVAYAGPVWAPKPYRFLLNPASLLLRAATKTTVKLRGASLTKARPYLNLKEMQRVVATEKKSKKRSGGG